ncbi:uncharacterized protein LOC143511713 [Brachyhypopomus gauderio]|uniref:uncharacterized protein LOC143511713 n=1 Tax=Brachyhypopomus gauderio TaxID=698409 RepID=UPI00404230C6
MRNMCFILWIGFSFIFKYCCGIQATDVQQKQRYDQNYTLQLTPCPEITAQQGNDVTLCCKVSLLPEFSTVWWEREGAPTANTTLFYNNTAFLLLHTVTHDSQGKYLCNLIYKGKMLTKAAQMLDVSKYSTQKKNILYRESSNHSDLLLICKSKKLYDRIMWIWHSEETNVVMIAAEEGREPNVTGPIAPGQHTTMLYNGQQFNFHISPVKFIYNGTYKCVVNDKTIYSTSVLHTLRVSAEPPGGVFRNRPVVLTCEVSEVTDHVTLAWLSMEGGRGVLVKQEVLTKSSSKTLSITVDSVSEEKHLWQCAVFTGKNLSALVPITLTAPTQTPSSGKPNHTAVLHKEGDGRVAEDTGVRTAVVVSCGVTVCVVVVVGILFFFCHKQSPADIPSMTEMTSTDAVRVAMVKPQEEDELHYASVTVVGLCHGTNAESSNSEMPSATDTTIYSTVNIS